MVRIRQLRRQERASISQRGKPKILLEVLPAVHPIHLDTENLKLIAYAVFVPRIAHGGKPRGTKGGRKAADGREFRSILHAARITEEEFDFRLRKQRQVVILPGITRIFEIAALLSTAYQARIDVIVQPPAHVEAIQLILLNAQGSGFVGVIAQTLRSEHDFVKQPAVSVF